MSEFRVPVVRLGKTGKHPNADTLSITQIEGGPCIFGTEDFKEGDLAVYVPVDAVVPETVPGTEFLGKHRRIKAKKIRGIFSMGILLPMSVLPGLDGNPYAFEFYTEGTDVAQFLKIVKYEEPEPAAWRTDDSSPPKCTAPVYDVESYRKYKHYLIPGESVVVTEKIHGTNSRFVVLGDELHVGSHNRWKKEDDRNLWWKVAKQYNLKEKLAKYPGYVLYGEIYGQVQDLKYGALPGELFFRAFDVFNSNTGRWLDPHDFFQFCDELGIQIVPVLWMGPYIPDGVEALAGGTSTLAENIREGVVIRPIVERWNNETGRTVLKLVSEQYLLRRGGTELH